MEPKDIIRYGDHCFITREDGVKIDEIRAFHRKGRNEHKGQLWYAFSITERSCTKDEVLWAPLNYDDGKWTGKE